MTNISISLRYFSLLIIIYLLMATGCATKPPTIAHTHIGHAITGWHDTPQEEGFIVVAEKMASESLQAAILAAKDTNNLTKTKKYTRNVMTTTDPPKSTNPDTVNYGVKQALTHAIGHLTYAATSEDATDNIRQFAATIENNAQTILDRCDLITVLGNDILQSSSSDEATLLAEEIMHLTRANLYGEESDGEAQLIKDPLKYGLKQVRRDIENMINRENPPYTTVNSWYLFNLIRLPDGSWIFRNRFEDQDDAYDSDRDGGGGY